MNCEICNKKTKHLEIHHIIPKSRGGSDDSGNLKRICSVCHGLAHNVSFSNDRGGLIKEGVDRKINKNKIDQDWLDKNQVLVQDKMIGLYNKNEDEHILMLLLLERGHISSSHLREWVELGRICIKTSLTFR